MCKMKDTIKCKPKIRYIMKYVLSGWLKGGFVSGLLTWMLYTCENPSDIWTSSRIGQELPLSEAEMPGKQI
jgi:hypothetical protein